MEKPKIIETKETELENLLVKFPDSIEEQLTILGRQIKTDSGWLDILATDIDGALVVIEVKATTDDGQLDQGLRYYDWVRANIPLISHSYSVEKGIKIDITQEPWLILIAPSFSKNMLRIVKYVDIPLIVMKSIVIKVPNNEKYVLCQEIEIEPKPDISEENTRSNILKYIRDEKIRTLCDTSLNQLEENGAEIRPLGGKKFSVWFEGIRFMRIYNKRDFYSYRTLQSNGEWISKRQKITNKTDWENAFQKDVTPILQYLRTRKSR